MDCARSRCCSRLYIKLISYQRELPEVPRPLQPKEQSTRSANPRVGNVGMDTTWSNFLFQTTPTQPPTDAGIQSELLPELASPTHTVPSEQMEEAPPSTVDTAALSEDPPPVKGQHVCVTCSKQFKSGYNLRRHQAVHRGVRRGGRAARGGAGGGRERQSVPLSLLQLIGPPTPEGHADTPPGSIATDTVTMVTTQPISTAVVVAGTTVQVSQSVVLASPLALLSGGASVCADAGVRTSVFAGAVPVQVAAPVRKNHACEACGKAFRDVYHLNRHRLSHSDEKPFSCPVCQQRFKRKDRMTHHVRSHQGGVDKPYVCPHCAKGFSRPDHLNSHVRQVHSTERPFKCPTCASAFATKDRLRAHLIRHEDKVPCHVCGKLLSPAYITDHMRVHNQSQHHVCHLCNRSFTTLTYLRVHAQKHHGGAWRECVGGRGAGGVLLCQLCGVHCKTPAQLQGHMGTHDPAPSAHSPVPAQLQGHMGTHDPAPSAHSPVPAQLQGHMGTHDPSPSAHSPAPSAQDPAHSTQSPAQDTPTCATITVTAGNNTVSLLVSDCSSITSQS
ncbi:hypothetical protein ACEWY4_026488 [Coilia grayii]|uniref:C2H2-type domain-containing protein n=1 Tax=Coilia grayii TaxID=363190 RepID=A0ABD1IUZ8_9TELE